MGDDMSRHKMKNSPSVLLIDIVRSKFYDDLAVGVHHKIGDMVDDVVYNKVWLVFKDPVFAQIDEEFDD
jgi:hypothetical protein